VIDQQPREFGREESAVLEDLARIVMDELELRVAARRVVDQEHELREQAERTAHTLQGSLLPPVLPQLPGATLASMYLPAATDEVGGDFYDAFQAEDGGWFLVIGDVSGKGTVAAAVTALVRNAIRTATLMMSGPTEILAVANRALLIGRQETQIENFCTALIARLDAQAEGFRITFSSAGHPAPLILSQNVEEIGSGGPPLGWYRDATFVAHQATLRSGDTLVLYTDGLSESRSGGELLGVNGILAAWKRSGADAESMAQILGDTFSSDAITRMDDAAALVLTVD
jgi:sigma-B regulation protein RsbU (phosphoserine phosphatase)